MASPYETVVAALRQQSAAIAKLAHEIEEEFEQWKTAVANQDQAQADAIAAAIGRRTARLVEMADALEESTPDAGVGGGPSTPPPVVGGGLPETPVDPGFGGGRPAGPPDSTVPEGGRPDAGLPNAPARPDAGLPNAPARPDAGLPGSEAQPK